MPTFSHGRTGELYVDDSGGTERNWTTYLSDDTFDQTADLADVTALSNTAKAFIAGITDRTLKFSGFYDPTFVGYAQGNLNTATQVKVFPAGSAAGRLYFDGTAIVQNLSFKSDVGSANAVEGEFQFIATPTFGTA